MSASRNTKAHTGFWFMDPLPFYLNVWLFKVNIISGYGKYTSFQKTPSGVTLRIVKAGKWTVSMCGIKKDALHGDIFCSIPSEVVEFSQTEDVFWKWYEIQFYGPAAEKFIGEFGLGRNSPVVSPENKKEALKIFRQINNYFNNKNRSVPELLSMLFRLIHVCGKYKSAPLENKSFSRDAIVSQAIDYLKSVPHFNANISEVADILNVDRTTLYRAFIARTGKSPHQYIDRMKVMMAEELLGNSDMPVSLAGKHLGFADVKYFNDWFKKKKGVPPGRWRRTNKKKS